MLKEAIEKIVELAKPDVYQVGDRFYTSVPGVEEVKPYIDRPKTKRFTSLDAIVKSLPSEFEMIQKIVAAPYHADECRSPIFVHVSSFEQVDVFTSYRQHDLDRDVLYTSITNIPKLNLGWTDLDNAIITLRSGFVETEDTKYILGLLSNITNMDSVKTTDNGLTQMVNIKKGISLQQEEKIKSRVTLKPFRTFLEVDQPESEFLLRMRRGDSENNTSAKIALFEADGGAWKLQAKHNIAEYFKDKLKDMIEAGKVIVLE